MKVLVTGATGRVGANVVKRLAVSGVAVRAMVTPGDAKKAKIEDLPNVELAEADLRDQNSVSRACRGVTHVVHLAAQMVLGGMPVDRFYDINSLGTLRLLEGVLADSDRFERFVLASTDSTYRPGKPPKLPLTEDVEQVPTDYYGTSKLLGEIILRNRAVQFDIPFSIVRFGTVLSPEEADGIYRLGFLRGWLGTQQRQGRMSTLWPLFDDRADLVEIFDAAVGDAPDAAAVSLTGPEGPWTLSVVDVRDAAQGVCRALTEPGAVGHTFNIAAAAPTRSDEGADAVAKIHGVPKYSVRLPFTWRLEISVDAARDRIGYKPAYDYAATLSAGIRPVVGESDPDGYIPAAEGDAGVFAKLSGKRS
ncbi:NAD(P)-dependent oxidoreductase [Saccharomonospora sp. NPDC006951]